MCEQRLDKRRRRQATRERTRLSALATNATRQLHVLGHDRDALGVNGAQVRVLKEADQVRLGRLLERRDGRRLEAQVGLEVLRNLAHEALERQLADQQLRRLLVATNLAQRNRARAETMRFLSTAGASNSARATGRTDDLTQQQRRTHAP